MIGEHIELKLSEWVENKSFEAYRNGPLPCFCCGRHQSPEVYFLNEIFARQNAALCYPCYCEHAPEPIPITNRPLPETITPTASLP